MFNIRMLKDYRVAVWTVLWVSALGVAASFTAQYVFGMNPCVMCIQQRVALMAVALMAWAMLLLDLNYVNRKIAALLAIAAPAAFGLYIAVKQIYLQSLPIMEQPSCGAPWTFRLRGAPFFEFYEPIIRGTGACGEVYKVLGVPLAWWSAAFFIAVLILLILSLWVSSQPEPKKYIARFDE